MSAAHEHDHAPRNFNRAFAVGIGLNVAFVAVESFYGWKISSLALLADAGHNLSDVAGLALAWAGGMAGRLAPDSRHTYGWRRASILAAFANAVLLLVAMGSLAWEAIARLRVPVQTEGLTMIAVAAVGVVINGATAMLFMSGRSRDLNIRGAFLHMTADALGVSWPPALCTCGPTGVGSTQWPVLQSPRSSSSVRGGCSGRVFT